MKTALKKKKIINRSREIKAQLRHIQHYEPSAGLAYKNNFILYIELCQK